jgi:hypothetical protein
MTFTNIFIPLLIHIFALPIRKNERIEDVVDLPEVGTPVSSIVGNSRLLRHGA